MPIDRSAFWTDWPPRGDDKRLPDLTPEMIARAESYFDVAFPPTYIDLLKIQNGGATRRFVVPIRDAPSWVGDCLDFDHLHGIGVIKPEPPDFYVGDGSDNIYMSPYVTREWGLPERQILLCGDGHTWISLDYRHGVHPAVTWFDNDAGPEFVDRIIAPSFDAFLASLLLEQEAIDAETGELKPEFRL